jgi:putative flippase GtrA
VRRIQTRSGTRGTEVLRFLIVGGANTVATALAFYGLSFIVGSAFAFTIAYAAGLVFTVSVTPRFVFRSRSTRARSLLLAAWYVVVYLVGLGVIALLDSVEAPRVLVVLGTLCVTAPLGFLGARWLVGRRAGIEPGKPVSLGSQHAGPHPPQGAPRRQTQGSGAPK